MVTSARWRRAVGDAQRWRRWTRVASGGLLAAAAAGLAQAWLALPAVQPIGKLPAEGVAAVGGAIIGMVVTPLAGLLWHFWRAPSRLIEDLLQRVSALEQARVSHPPAHVRFQFDTASHKALLHITNYGEDAEFCAPLIIEGSLAGRLNRATFARWEHVDAATASIPSGETRTLCLACLDLSTFPFAQWQVYATTEESACVLRGLHTSVIGGDGTAHAPTMFLDVSVMTTPVPREGIANCTIALHAFEAQRLRP